MHDPQRDASPGRRELPWQLVPPPGTPLLHPTPVVSLAVLTESQKSSQYLFCMCLLPGAVQSLTTAPFHDTSDCSFCFSKVDVME